MRRRPHRITLFLIRLGLVTNHHPRHRGWDARDTGGFKERIVVEEGGLATPKEECPVSAGSIGDVRRGVYNYNGKRMAVKGLYVPGA